MPLKYIWQPDRNFRAARSRNLGIVKASGDWLIFVDGDCLLPSNFVSNHLYLAKFGKIVAGGRHLLSDSETKDVLRKISPTISCFSGWKFSHLNIIRFRDLDPFNWKSVRTCNVALSRLDVLSVGGFDERYIGWGLEDSDFIVRLLKKGLRVRSARLSACVSHLHHTSLTRDGISVNTEYFLSVLSNPDEIVSQRSVLSQI